MKFVALDFETTGVVGGWPNEPWQLGVVAFDAHGIQVASRREFFFHIDRARPFSTRAPGRWAQMREVLATSPTWAEQWPDIADILVGAHLVAHNAATERTILTKRAPLTAFGPWIDTLTLARTIYPRLPSHTLGDVITAFGLQSAVDELVPDRTWHDALYDACAGAVFARHLMTFTDWRVFSPQLGETL